MLPDCSYCIKPSVYCFPHHIHRDTAIPSAYDLRNVDGKSYVTSIKNQNPWGTCWAHAAIGAMESNYLKKGGDTLDLSEMHLAYFTYINADKTKAFDQNYSVSRVLDEGGNSYYPAALYSRLDGPVLESEVPYPTTPSKNTPESYTRVLRLREVYYLNFSNINVNVSDTQRNIVKRRIMDTGAVVANYYDDDNGYSTDEKSYYYKTSTSRLIPEWMAHGSSKTLGALVSLTMATCGYLTQTILTKARRSSSKALTPP